jgi:hypothetical protein
MNMGRGRHVDRVIIDEATEIPDEVWDSLKAIEAQILVRCDTCNEILRGDEIAEHREKKPDHHTYTQPGSKFMLCVG